MKVVAISIALALAGCSLFMKTNPENWEPRLAPTCSDRKTAPLLDTIAAGAGVAAASYGAVCLSLEDGDTARERCTRFALVPGIASALLYGVPALLGWHRVSKCRRTWREHEAWLRPEVPATEAHPAKQE